MFLCMCQKMCCPALQPQFFVHKSIEASGEQDQFPQPGGESPPPRGIFTLQNPVTAEDTEVGVLSYTPEANRTAQSSYYSYFNHGFNFTNPSLKPYTVLNFYGSS